MAHGWISCTKRAVVWNKFLRHNESLCHENKAPLCRERSISSVWRWKEHPCRWGSIRRSPSSFPSARHLSVTLPSCSEIHSGFDLKGADYPRRPSPVPASPHRPQRSLERHVVVMLLWEGACRVQSWDLAAAGLSLKEEEWGLGTAAAVYPDHSEAFWQGFQAWLGYQELVTPCPESAGPGLQFTRQLESWKVPNKLLHPMQRCLCLNALLTLVQIQVMNWGSLCCCSFPKEKHSVRAGALVRPVLKTISKNRQCQQTIRPDIGYL